MGTRLAEPHFAGWRCSASVIAASGSDLIAASQPPFTLVRVAGKPPRLHDPVHRRMVHEYPGVVPRSAHILGQPKFSRAWRSANSGSWLGTNPNPDRDNR